MYEVFSKLILQRNMTPYAISKATGVGQDVLSRWKNGISKPSIDNMQLLANYLGVTVDYLLTGETPQKEKALDPEIDGDIDLVSDPLIAFYGEVKEELTEGDMADIKALMEFKAKRNREKGNVP